MQPPTGEPPENIKSRLKESYDAVAEVYNTWTVPHSASRLKYLGQLLQLLPRSQDAQISVLELGCGAGVPVTEKLLADPRISVTANDLSSTQISMAKSALGTERVDWIEGDMMALEFPNESFDAVLGFYSVIHLPRDEQLVLVQRITAWLKPGGLMLVNFASEDKETVVMEKWLDDKGWMFWSGWGADAMIKKVGEAGLDIVHGEIAQDVGDAEFLWVIARKPGAEHNK
jgi:ubiquinone/menaquinone biosynthesis C-methylase UbiE